MKLTFVGKIYLASCLLFPLNAFGAPLTAAPDSPKAKPALLIRSTEAEKSVVNMEVSVIRGYAEGMQFGAFDTIQKQSLSVRANPVPVNLRILVDTSSLCHLLKLDQQASDLLALVKRTFPKESLLSIVTFNSGGIEVYENQRRLEDWKGTAIPCKGVSLASSFEKAMLATFQKGNNQLPNVVWVLSSGNVELSRDAALVLKQQEATLHVLLHNPILEKEIRHLMDRTASIIGSERVHLTPVSTLAPGFLPDQRFQLTMNPPFGQGKSQSIVQVSVSRGGQLLASDSVTVEVVVSPLRLWVQQIAQTLAVFAVMALVIYLIKRVVQYYRPKYCMLCEKQLRHSETVCLFCHADEEAFLVGKFNYRDRAKAGHSDVVRLRAAIVELGTHRKSAIPLIAPQGQRRECLAKIVKEGDNTFRLEKSPARASLSVNGFAIQTRRYLASGDVIQMGGQEFKFVTNRSANHG